jgi:pyridoxamine 5'-phosphate oxidase
MSDSVQPSLKELRWDYASDTLHRQDLAEDPLTQFSTWFEDAVSAKIREPNAMTLSTIGLDGCPTSRTVLMKDYTAGGITFFTNYESRKAKELAASPVASLLFFWKELERQAHVRGKVEKVSGEESDQYFYSRPYNSRIGAWASRQSEEIPDRQWLSDRVRKYEDRYPETDTIDCVPRPEFWGGYRLVPETVEFWQGQPGRKHDRFVYRRNGSNWEVSRWSP